MNKKHEAQQLYMNGCRTQKEIADIVGVSERTVHTWIHQYQWDKLRLAAYHAPATIADNLCSQIVELQNAIARKEPGARYPTPQEAEVMRKLIVCLEKVKKTPSLSQNMQMLETFRNYVRPLDKEFAKKLSTYTNKLLNAKATNGYAPYQAEYGVEAVPPLSHIYDEVPQEEEENGNIPQSGEASLPNKITLGTPGYQACPDITTCLHQGDCTYPKCLHPERYIPPVDPVTLYRTTPILNDYYNAGTISSSDCDFEEALTATTGNFPAPEESKIEAITMPPDSNEPHTLASLRGTKQPRVTPPEPTKETGSFPATPQYKTAENKIIIPEDTESANNIQLDNYNDKRTVA